MAIDLIQKSVQAQARRMLWEQGNLRHLTRQHGQRLAYDTIHNFHDVNPILPGPIVINTHRGLGKTVLMVLVLLEYALKHPGSICRFGSATYLQAREVFNVSLDPLLDSLPPTIGIKRARDSVEVWSPLWPEGSRKSRIQVVGFRELAGARRGERANAVALDEAREFDDLKNSMVNVALPMFIGRDHPLLVVASTPPDMPGHYFSADLIPQAMQRDCYVCIPGSENEDYTPEEDAKMLAVMIERSSVAYRREIECELIADLSKLATPEFTTHREEIVVEPERPKFFYPVAGMDLGFKDYNAVVYGYINFLEQKLVIEHETVCNSITTEDLSQRIKGTLGAHYAKTPLFHLMRKWSDNNCQQLYDLHHTHGVTFADAEKHDKWAALAQLRTGLQVGRILIHPRCKHLIYQLENTIYNKNRTDFQRMPDEDSTPDSPIQGHADALMALLYLYRMCQSMFRQNPFPAHMIEANQWQSQVASHQAARITITKNSLTVSRDGRHISSGPSKRIR